MRIFKQFLFQEKGQAILEFALVLPVFIVTIISIIAIGYIFAAEQVITYAVSAGARIGAQTNSNSQVNGMIQEIMGNFDKDFSRTVISISPETENSPERQRGKQLSVSIKYKVPFSIPLINSEQLSLNAKSIARIEYENDQ